MLQVEVFALAGFAVAAIAMLLVTQTKARVAWPAWVVPVLAVVPVAAWTGVAIVRDGLFGFWPLLSASPWARAGDREEVRGLGAGGDIHWRHRLAADARQDGVPRAAEDDARGSGRETRLTYSARARSARERMIADAPGLPGSCRAAVFPRGVDRLRRAKCWAV